MSDPSGVAQDELCALAARQGGAVARRQLSGIGVGRPTVRRELRARRWQRVLPGVFVVFTGPLPGITRVWAALLYAGPDAMASHDTAAWLGGLRENPPRGVDVLVPHGHRHRPSRGWVRVRQTRRYAERRHPARSPAQTTIETTVLDVTERARSEGPVIDVVLRACQLRLTTAARLSMAARARRRLRWRRLLGELFADVTSGVQSPLERRYLHDVERAHRLPRGSRNRPERSESGERRYRDVRYRRWHVVVELDGRAAHPVDAQERDDLRDNDVAERKERTLRYGWHSVALSPCTVAAQVARLLAQQSWPGTPSACGPACPFLLESA